MGSVCFLVAERERESFEKGFHHTIVLFLDPPGYLAFNQLPIFVQIKKQPAKSLGIANVY